MVKLLIIADDLTGALDTGVQLAADGIMTLVTTDIKHDLEVAAGTQVLVISTETRHLSADEAYGIVFEITRRALALGIPHIYKKTDSALRGNIGSELAAVQAAAGEAVHFVPAYPLMNRTTRVGVHYIDGVPVHESVFGNDPFEPVRHSDVAEIIAEQSEVRVEVVERQGASEAWETGIVAWDASTDEDLTEIGRLLADAGALRITAGCAGFANLLPELLGLEGVDFSVPALEPGLLVLCGSVNEITGDQLDYAADAGFGRIKLTHRQKYEDGYWQGAESVETLKDWTVLLEKEPAVIIQSNGQGEMAEPGDLAEKRGQVSQVFGRIMEGLLEPGLKHTVMIIGGDTLLGCMAQLGVSEMLPLRELLPGTVLSLFRYQGRVVPFLSKSGGFGQRTLLVEIARQIQEQSMM